MKESLLTANAKVFVSLHVSIRGTSTSAMLNIVNSLWPALSSHCNPTMNSSASTSIQRDVVSTAVSTAVVAVPPSYQSPEGDSENRGGAKLLL